MRFKLIPFAVLLIFGVTSCVKDDLDLEVSYYEKADFELLSKSLNLPAIPFNYNFKVPVHVNSFVSEKNSDLATLGRVLFYDKNLSKDKSISCASCHKQNLAFSDDKSFSDGVSGRLTTRNSIAFGSLASFETSYGDNSFGSFNGGQLFWDNRATTIQEQSRETLANPNEMDMHMNEVLEAVNKLEYYKPLAKAAFNTTTLQEDHVLNSIAEFINSIPNFETKLDKAISKTLGNSNFIFIGLNASQNLLDFNEQENRGKNIYLENCASCHGNNLVTVAKQTGNNGLALTYADKGIANISLNTNDIGVFKVPNLRNVALTGPYMHDGSIATLSDVIDHYSNGIKAHKNLSSELRNTQGPIKMSFNSQQKQDLLAFLNTLTNEELAKDVKFSDPFR